MAVNNNAEWHDFYIMPFCDNDEFIMNGTKDWIDCEGVSSLIVEDLGEVPLLRVEESLLLDLRRIERMMRCLEVSQGVELFSCSQGRDAVRVKATRLGSDFVSNLLQGVSKFDYHFPVHEINPYIEVFYKCIDQIEGSLMLNGWTGLINEDAFNFSEKLNSLVCFARCEMSSKAFKNIKRRFNKASTKRSNSLEGCSEIAAHFWLTSDSADFQSRS
jgi:hypothetical protein